MDRLSSPVHFREEIMKALLRLTLITMLFLVFGIFVPQSHLDAEVTIDYLGSTLWTNVNDLIVIGDYAYCAMTYGFRVYDVSDPSDPEPVSQVFFPGGDGTGLAIIGDYAYVAAGDSGLVVIDISDPLMPAKCGEVGGVGSIEKVAQYYDYLLAVPGDSGMTVFDLSTPCSPTLEREFQIDGSTNITTFEKLAFVTIGDAGLEILSVYDPLNPDSISTCETPGTAVSVFVTEDYAYVADMDSGLQVIDISNAETPSLIGSHPAGDDVYDVMVIGSYAYVADGYDGLDVVDISTPSAPYSAGTRNTSGVCISVFVVGSVAFMGERIDHPGGLQTINVFIPSSPTILGGSVTAATIRVTTRDDFAYCASSYSGMHVVDISDPSAPYVISTLEDVPSARDIAMSGDYAIVGSSYSLKCVDISDPYNPSVVGSCDLPTMPMGVTVRENLAYVADYTSGLIIVDISDPKNPDSVGSWDSPDMAHHVFVEGDYAYVADYYGGFHVVNISDPENPDSVASINPTTGIEYQLIVKGDIAYGLSGTKLVVLDVADPTSPSTIDIISLPTSAVKMDIHGKYLFANCRAQGVAVYSLENPLLPSLVTTYDTPASALGIEVIDNQIAYIADYSGFIILSVSLDCADSDVDGICDDDDNCPNVYNPGQEDSDENGIGDACPVECGDVNRSGDIDIDDIIYVIDYMFTGGPAPDPIGLGDTNCSGDIDIDDIIFVVDYMFTGGRAPCDIDGDTIPDC